METIKTKLAREALSRNLYYLTFKSDTIWTRMGAFGDVGNTRSDKTYPTVTSFSEVQKKQVQPTGKLIERFTNFMHDGGEEMLIPIMTHLVKPPNVGDNQLLGTEEDPDVLWLKTRINGVSKSTNIQTGKMNAQRINHPAVKKSLMKGAHDRLANFMTTWIGLEPYYTTYLGYSTNILKDIKLTSKLEITEKYHPNFFVAGAGRVEYDEDQTNYATNIATALDTLSDLPSKRFGSHTLTFIRKMAPILGIRKSLIKGRYGYHVMAGPGPLADLAKDEDWKEAQKIRKRGDDNPLITGDLEGYFNQCWVWSDDNQFDAKISGDTGYSSDRGIVNYGNADQLENNQTTTNRHLISVYGQSAITQGISQALDFMDENYDYGRKKSEACEMLTGFQLANIWDVDGVIKNKNTLYKNQSSMVISVWSDGEPTI
ncbi:MAG: DUF4043 family protein [Ignavibacteria bacterium]|jgi:hypothetical protein